MQKLHWFNLAAVSRFEIGKKVAFKMRVQDWTDNRSEEIRRNGDKPIWASLGAIWG